MNPVRLTLFFLFLSLTGFTQEICNNGIDDDANGLIDLNDPACACNMYLGNPGSFIPNPSLEDTLYCPFLYAWLSCAEQWFGASDATSDYFNTCGTMLPSLTNSMLVPFPDGEGAAGVLILADDKEYLGTCLTTTLTAGTSYTLQMHVGIIGMDHFGLNNCDVTNLEPANWALFGTTNCSDLPFTGFDCPPAPFIELGSVSVPTDGAYHVVTITFTPTTDINGIAIGSSCTVPPNYPTTSSPCFSYAVADNFILNTTDSFDSFITESGNLCTNNLVLTATMADPSGTFQWYEDGIALPGQTGSTLAVSALGLDSGNYQVVYTMGAGCLTLYSTVESGVMPVIDVNDGNICEGASVLLTATGADSYSWSPSNGLSAITGATVTADPNNTIIYTVIGTTNDCSDTATATVTVSHDVIVQVNDQTICKGEETVLTASGADSYTWSPETGLSSATEAAVTFSGDQTTIYTVTGNIGDCEGTTQATVIVNTVDLNGFATPSELLLPDAITTLHAEPATNSYTWFLEDGTQLNGSAVTCTLGQYPGVQTIMLIGTNSMGCIDSMAVSVNVIDNPLFYVPNTFTPDGDEFNNVFQPIFTYGFDPYNFELIIYNRWGEILFESHDAGKGWDGTYQGRIAPQGTYSWTISFKSLYTDKKTAVEGHVTLIR